MRLLSLDIQALPGIEPIALDDFSAGTNFIIGPNAIGKSSLGRALHYLLAGRQPNDPDALTLSARFADDQGTWTVSRNGPAISWLRDGTPTDPPPLPSAEVLACYWLRAETLIAGDQASEAQLSRRLREALAGGINMDAVRASANLTTEPFPNKLLGEWREAQRQRAAVERDYEALERSRERLPVLEDALRDARIARDHVEKLRQGQRLTEAIAECETLNRRLAQFDVVHARIKGDEAQIAEQLNTTITELKTALQATRLRIDTIDEKLAATGLADQQPDRADLKALQQQLEALRQLEQSWQQAHEQAAAAAANEKTIAEGLGEVPETLPRFTPQQVEALTDALQAEREARAWQTPALTVHNPIGKVSKTLLLTAGTGGILALVAGALSSNLLAMAGGLIATAGAMGAWAAAQFTKPAAAGNPMAAQALQEAQGRLHDLIGEYGLNHGELAGMGLARFMERVQQLDAAREQTAVANAKTESIQQRLETMRAQIVTALQPWQTITQTDTATLQGHFDALCERLEQARSLQQERLGEIQSQKRVSADLKEAQSRHDAVYKALDLQPGDRAGLQRLLDAHSDYEATQKARLQAEISIETLKTPLTDDEPFIQWVTQAAGAEIEAAIDEQQTQANRIDSLTEKIASLKARLEQAGGDQALTKAIAKVQDLQDQLSERREAQVAATLGDWLLGSIEADYRQSHEPALIRDARERFEAFTHHQWSFEVNENHEPVARDLRYNEVRPLTALSSGTRMQLLLAARMAWAREQESKHSPLPLILDEALTNTDAQRFRTIAENLEQLVAEEGRQIFYLTARTEDLSLWHQATAHEPACIDLATVRHSRHATPVLPAEPIKPSYPPPAQQSASEYAQQLAVPAINPTADAASIPVFYLLADHLDCVHELMNTWGIERLGPLEHWLQSPAGRAGAIKHPPRDELLARTKLARAWQALAAEGRGRRADYAPLAASNALSEIMLPRVAEKAEELGGDAQALIKALRDREVSHLKQGHIDALEQWLLDNGFIDPRPRRSTEQITQTLLGQFGHQLTPATIHTIISSLNAAVIADDAPTGLPLE